MKNLNILLFISFLVLLSQPVPVLGQMGQKTQTKVEVRKQHITELIEVSFNKTTHLIFDLPIRYADRGSEDFIAELPAALTNTLRLKASKKYFKPTNLTVVTTDGKLYHFLVNYADEPKKLRVSFLAKNRSLQSSKLSKEREISELSEADLHALAYQASTTPINLNKRNSWLGMKLVITGLYARGDFIFVKYTLTNNSKIIYKIKQISYYLKDKKTPKRASSQEVSLRPIFSYTSPNPLNEPLGESQVWRDQTAEKVVVFSKSDFRISATKLFQIEILGEDRDIEVSFPSKLLLKARGLEGGERK